MKKGQETYGEALRNLHNGIHDFRDAVLGVAPFSWIKNLFRWGERHEIGFVITIILVAALALLPFIAAFVHVFLKPVK